MNNLQSKNQVLENIYTQYLSEKMSIGIDGTSNSQFASQLSDEIAIISRKLSNASYDFSLYREKLIPKGQESNPRVISIPTNRDKLVLKFVNLFLSKTYGKEASSPAIKGIIGNIKKQMGNGQYDSFIKLDIKTFFPTVNHKSLLKFLSQKIDNQLILQLIEKAITQTTVSYKGKNRKKYSNVHGIPQGLSISGQLANIFLLGIDKKYGQSNSYQYYRYVDDILILCHQQDIQEIFKNINADMKYLSLSLHEMDSESEKSSYGNLNDEFQYLGFSFQGTNVSVRESSIDKIYDGINKVFLKYYKYSKLKEVSKLKKKLKPKKYSKIIKKLKNRRLEYFYHKLNLKITGCVCDGKQYGWLHFFDQINDQNLLFKLDAYVKKSCIKFNVPYNEKIIKKFSRVFYELIDTQKSNYIPIFNYKTPEVKQILNEISEDIEIY